MIHISAFQNKTLKYDRKKKHFLIYMYIEINLRFSPMS